jgi:hypothetical protein
MAANQAPPLRRRGQAGQRSRALGTKGPSRDGRSVRKEINLCGGSGTPLKGAREDISSGIVQGRRTVLGMGPFLLQLAGVVRGIRRPHNQTKKKRKVVM